MTICAVIAVDRGTYYGSSAVPVLSEKIASSFPKIHSSTSPLALISRRTRFPPQLVERINTPSVFCLLPCLTTCILNASLGFRLGVVLSSNIRFASFDFVLHWLEFSHPPPASFTFALLTLTKIPHCNILSRGILRTRREAQPHFNKALYNLGLNTESRAGRAHREIQQQEDSNQGG